MGPCLPFVFLFTAAFVFSHPALAFQSAPPPGGAPPSGGGESSGGNRTWSGSHVSEMSSNVISGTVSFNRTGGYGGTLEEPDPDYDYWFGDDELRQNASWHMSPKPSNNESAPGETAGPVAAAAAPLASTYAMQNFQMVDYHLVTEEVGFPVDHVHPKAELRASWVWSYDGPPQASMKMRVKGRLDADFDISGAGAVGTGCSTGLASTDCLSLVRVTGPDIEAVDENGDPESLLNTTVQLEGYCNIGGERYAYIRWTTNGAVVEKKKKDGSTEVTPSGAAIEGGLGYSHSLDDRSFLFAHNSTQSGSINQTIEGDELSVSIVMLSRVTQNGASNNWGIPPAVANGRGESSATLIPNLTVQWTADP